MSSVLFYSTEDLITGGIWAGEPTSCLSVAFFYIMQQGPHSHQLAYKAVLADGKDTNTLLLLERVLRTVLSHFFEYKLAAG